MGNNLRSERDENWLRSCPARQANVQATPAFNSVRQAVGIRRRAARNVYEGNSPEGGAYP
jgi:hypothetical protein